MTWRELKPQLGRGSDNYGVRVSMQRFFTVTIGSDVVALLGWKARDAVRLLIGAGEHAGALRIVRETRTVANREAYMLLPGSKGASTLKLRRRRLPGIDGRHALERVDYRIVDGALEIALPDWSKAPDAPPKPADRKAAEVERRAERTKAPPVPALKVAPIDHALAGRLATEKPFHDITPEERRMLHARFPLPRADAPVNVAAVHDPAPSRRIA